MLLQRDLTVIVLTLGIAAALYAFSFRDLAVADPVLSGTVSGADFQQSISAPVPIPAFAG
jgi:hypothetical protein